LGSNESRERRSDERLPIRLEVVYRSARSLVTEYTSSVSKGGCRLQCKQPLEVGTRFLFEMIAARSRTPVELLGEVVWCRPGTEAGLYEVGIRYVPSDDKRAALEAMLEEIFREHDFETARLHVRVPVNLVARDTVEPALKYLVRDISRGGLGLRLPMDVGLPAHLKPRTLVSLAVRLNDEITEIGGEVVWTLEGQPGLTHAAMGVAFLGLRPYQLKTIDTLSRLNRPAELALTLAPRS
jgi:uncharacterized protein (TIGR02266 family)